MCSYLNHSNNAQLLNVQPRKQSLTQQLQHKHTGLLDTKSSALHYKLTNGWYCAGPAPVPLLAAETSNATAAAMLAFHTYQGRSTCTSLCGCKLLHGHIVHANCQFVCRTGMLQSVLWRTKPCYNVRWWPGASSHCSSMHTMRRYKATSTVEKASKGTPARLKAATSNHLCPKQRVHANPGVVFCTLLENLDLTVGPSKCHDSCCRLTGKDNRCRWLYTITTS
jgi:hypothetical protein